MILKSKRKHLLSTVMQPVGGIQRNFMVPAPEGQVYCHGYSDALL